MENATENKAVEQTEKKPFMFYLHDPKGHFVNGFEGKEVVVCDLDGTLVANNHVAADFMVFNEDKQKHVIGDWDEFYKACAVRSERIEDVCAEVLQLKAEGKIVVVLTARSEIAADDTIKQIEDIADCLIMSPSDHKAYGWKFRPGTKSFKGHVFNKMADLGMKPESTPVYENDEKYTEWLVKRFGETNVKMVGEKPFEGSK